jgi:antitoxin (DNA-binding transcriptional repressor) of toxin-antitoxin stability system
MSMTDATKITATEAARRFSELLNRVRYAGESFLVVRNGELMCRIEPASTDRVAKVADLLEVLARGPARDQGFADDLEQAQRRQPRLPESPWES